MSSPSPSGGGLAVGARLGTARHGRAWRSRLGVAGLGQVRQGGQGPSWHGVARLGGLGMAVLGGARQGGARRSWRGTARLGAARQGGQGWA